MPPRKGEDTCDHVERISEIAWHNGAYKANEKLLDENARLKAEVERLRASSFVTAVPVEQYERVVKAGEVVAIALILFEIMSEEEIQKRLKAWSAAKEGKQP